MTTATMVTRHTVCKFGACYWHIYFPYVLTFHVLGVDSIDCTIVRLRSERDIIAHYVLGGNKSSSTHMRLGERSHARLSHALQINLTVYLLLENFPLPAFDPFPLILSR
jgi:hypothetical protein